MEKSVFTPTKFLRTMRKEKKKRDDRRKQYGRKEYKKKEDGLSPPKIERYDNTTVINETFHFAISARNENVQQNGSAAAIGSSLLKIVDEREGTKNRRSNNIILNEEIQKEERADKKEESIATKTNRVPPVVSAQPSALLSKLSAFLPQ